MPTQCATGGEVCWFKISIQGRLDSNLQYPSLAKSASTKMRILVVLYGLSLALEEVDMDTSKTRSASCYESQPLMKTCGTQCYSSPNQAQCSAACLRGNGIGFGCAHCLGSKIQCTVKSCLGSCAANANSMACRSCVRRSCGFCNSQKAMEKSLDETSDDVDFAVALASFASNANSRNMDTSKTRSASSCYESQPLMKTCGTQCYSSPNQAQCSATCLRGKGIGFGCARCLGSKIQCTVKSCLGSCAANANSMACRSCVRRSCGFCNSQKAMEKSLDETSDDVDFAVALASFASNANSTNMDTSKTRSASSCYESQPLMKTCGTQCYSSPNQAQCSATCLRGKGIGFGCARCLGSKIQCTVKSCLGSCAANANSMACRSCVRRSCGFCNSQKAMEKSLDETSDDVDFAVALASFASNANSTNMDTSKTRSASSCYESQPLMKTCGTQCYSSPNQAQCSATCLRGKGIGFGCASCLGSKIQCTVKSCLGSCAANANSMACRSCVRRSCGSCNSQKAMDEVSYATALAELAGKGSEMPIFP